MHHAQLPSDLQQSSVIVCALVAVVVETRPTDSTALCQFCSFQQLTLCSSSRNPRLATMRLISIFSVFFAPVILEEDYALIRHEDTS